MTFKLSSRTKDLTGEKFGLLTVLSYAGQSEGKSKINQWLCKCDCGEEEIKFVTALNKGQDRCKKCAFEQMGESYRKHDKSKAMKNEPTYITWKSMKARCNNPNATGYKNYGGRGIEVCERWNDYANFVADMGKRPDGMTIDRIDGDGNYEPSNCRWATDESQTNNRRTNHAVTYKGESLTISQLAKSVGVDRRCMRNALELKEWDGDLAVQHLINRNVVSGDTTK